MKEHFYLIESERFTTMGRWFVRKKGDYFINRNGGRTPIDGHKIIHSFFCEEYDLDHSLTHLCDADSRAGWLSLEGIFHGCPEKEHIEYSELVLHKDATELENIGWVHIYGDPADTANSFAHTGELSQAQRKWLKEHGHYVSEFGESKITS